MVWYKLKNLIPNTSADKILNAIANKVINIDKKEDIQLTKN